MQIYLRSNGRPVEEIVLGEKNWGLNKVRLSLKRHFSIIFQFIQQGFYVGIKIVKSQKRKAFWLFKPIFSLWNLKFYIWRELQTDTAFWELLPLGCFFI